MGHRFCTRAGRLCRKGRSPRRCVGGAGSDMILIDWIVLVGTLAAIVLYGVWKTRGAQDLDTYFRGGNTLAWPTIGLSIMATQASAITFLSAPGQAYEDGMRFVQIYFGLPLAMIVISAVFLPIYHRLRVYTAYEFLEHRFDARVRYLGAFLFLIQRGMAVGITIYAPALILSTILRWPLTATNVGIGVVVIAYTVLGGTRAVSQTQKVQMLVMFSGILLAIALIALRLPNGISVWHAVKLAGALDRMNPVTFELDPNSRYNFWAGITGGFFLALSYFGTDQSQVQRYISGRSLAESRLGLIFNGFVKIPMQALILFSGVLLFVFYLFVMPPIFFNTTALDEVRRTSHSSELSALEERYARACEKERLVANAYVHALSSELHVHDAKLALRAAAREVRVLREEARRLVARSVPHAEVNDADYVFVDFVLRFVPTGFVGLLIAVIFCAAMSSTAGELAALGTTTTMDLYLRTRTGEAPATHQLRVSKLFTALWGVFAIAFASFASLFDNLIEAVNILGSLFYGTLLGIFIVGFFLPSVSAPPVLAAAAVAEGVVVTLFVTSELGYLWYNVLGSGLVVLIALGLEPWIGSTRRTQPAPS